MPREDARNHLAPSEHMTAIKLGSETVAGDQMIKPTCKVHSPFNLHTLVSGN
jgi:hypothetical protein